VVSWVVNSRSCHFWPHRRHRDENPLAVTPLDSAFTNRDARNSFRIRIYENSLVVWVFLTKILKGILEVASQFERAASLPLPLLHWCYLAPSAIMWDCNFIEN
jgi:hypothetical protein